MDSFVVLFVVEAIVLGFVIILMITLVNALRTKPICIKRVSIVLIMLLGAGVLAGWSYFSYQAKANYNYTLEDVHYSHSAEGVTFDVAINNIRKEKNDEDVYEFTFKSEGTRGLSHELPKSEYENIIGEDSNTKRTQVYRLELLVPAKLSTHRVSYISVEFYRYACFGETNFTKEEIRQYTLSVLEPFTQFNASGDAELPLSVSEANSTAISFGGFTTTPGYEKRWYKKVIDLVS